jgi:hypothetical protein
MAVRRALAAGVGKPPREETAMGARVVVPPSYGESTAVALERERNFSFDV